MPPTRIGFPKAPPDTAVVPPARREPATRIAPAGEPQYRPRVNPPARADDGRSQQAARPSAARPPAARPSARSPRNRAPSRDGGGRPSRPGRRPNWGRRIGVTLVVLLLLVVGFGVYTDTSLDRVAALPSDSATTSEGTNYLIVGSDSRSGLSEEQRAEYATGDPESELTDTIMLLHTGSGPSTLVSLPRDSMVDIPGHGRHKINSAYARGEAAEAGTGPELLVRTVEGATGLHIDHYIQIGFLGLVSVVDAVGGVDLCVPEAITDDKAGLDIEAGCQTLDQATALGYVRTRATASSDFGRVERQRAFISALLQRATSPSTLFNPFRIIPLANGLSGSITVDEGAHVWTLAQLGFAMRGLSTDGISTTVPVVPGTNVNWDRDRALALFDALAADEVPPENGLGP